MLWNEHAPVKIIEAVVITLSTILVGSLLAFRLQQIYNKNKMMTFTETIWWTWSNVSRETFPSTMCSERARVSHPFY